MYLLRHGETAWNLVGRMQGHLDSPLTQRGENQAQQIGRKLKRSLADQKIEMIASPLGRTARTAEIVADEIGIDREFIDFDEALKEVNWGDWNGHDRAEIEAGWPDLWAARLADKWLVRPPGGESYADLAERTSAWLEEHCEQEDLIVVSHGAIGRVMRGLYLNLKSSDILSLAEPQDAYFYFGNGRIVRYDITE